MIIIDMIPNTDTMLQSIVGDTKLAVTSKISRFVKIYWLSHELDFTIRIDRTLTFLYFDL